MIFRCAALLRRAEALRQLLPELHRLSLLSSAIDQPLRLVDEAEGMNILTERKDGAFSRAMSNSFGFGGHNSAVVFGKYKP